MKVLNPMLSQEIRKKFLAYFKKRGHTLVPSSPTVPHDDPTLLFINAGMNQFKDVFLGKTSRDYQTATSSQKCIRVGGKHNDLDNVGHTKRHITFFEMLGNFSFGDYFKKEAIAFAWEVATSIFNFPEEKLFVSVYEKDDEAFELWKPLIGEKKISRIGEKDNFWAMGDTGPCGPCSELFYDRGPNYGKASTIHEDLNGERFLEFWNLVFMEYNRDETGNMTKLPKQSVDTGAGLERIVSLIMDVPSVFQTDIFQILIQKVEEISGKPYDPTNFKLAPAFHVIADHIRSLSFAIADGAQPSNIERGYVLRKILRRAVRYGRILGLTRPFLASMLPPLIETMGQDFHELQSAQDRIAEILTVEEESFLQTLQRGGNMLSGIIDHAQKTPQKQISGHEAFKLKDTYGFPLEEVLLIAKDSGLSVDLDQYQTLEKQAKERSRQSKQAHTQTAEKPVYEDFVSHHGTSTFIGYEETKHNSTIKGLIVKGKLVEALEEGQEAIVILDETPFYPEKGGQVGDRGTLSHHKALFTVKDCQAPYPGVIAHIGSLEQGTLLVGEPLVATIDLKRRSQIERHHTATHLLHYALEQILGSHIRQAGSLVEPSRLRFDFNHHKPLTRDELRQIEILVNEKIWENSPLTTYELSLEDAHKHPEIKQFFGDKYDKKVRVVAIDHYSKELCGGTHVSSLGQIGPFRILKESSIAKGVRRIEAVIGIEAEKHRFKLEDQLFALSALLKSKLPELDLSVKALLEENESLKKTLLSFQKKELENLADQLVASSKQTKGIQIVASILKITKKELVELGNILSLRLKSGVILLGQIEDERCQLLLKVSPDLVTKGIHANTLIQQISSYIGGSGGGKKDAAQAGGKNTDGIQQAINKAKEIIENS
jgi:alanyl-tRNA synthetase